MKAVDKQQKKVWDVVVIGGGPAGMMAAGRAAERGARVLLIEKNPSLGKKLLITGGGRCNVTNAERNTRALLAHFKGSDQFLFSPFSQWNTADTIQFFNERGMPTKTEDLLRVFPVSNSAASVLNVLVNYMKAGKVTVQTDDAAKEITATQNNVTSILLASGKKITAASYVLATGGTSRPETGSTGDGFRFLRAVGHQIREPDASLVPIALKDTWTKALSGLTLPDVKISVYQGTKRFTQKRGKLLFTHTGVSGPTILNMSKGIGELLAYGPVTLHIDLFPTLDVGALDALLVTHFQTNANKQLKNSLSALIPTALAGALLELVGIDPITPCHSLTKEVRRALGQLFKATPLEVRSLLGADKAIVTSGGVPLTEVDTKTMRSRIIKNLYVIGDVLDIDRPSGGYSLQLCWTTGFVAGNSIPLPNRASLKKLNT